MSENETVTPEPEAANPPTQEATPPEQAKAEAPKPQEDLIPRAAYVGLQTNINKLHSRLEGVLGQNRELVTTIDAIKKDQRELLRATGGDDAVKASAAREAQALAQVAAQRAATASEQLIKATADLLADALEAAGVARNDPSIDWAQDATDVNDWYARVRPAVTARIQKAKEEHIASQLKTAQAKSQEEIKAEAAALAQRTLKEVGADKIDTAKGTSTTNYVDRVKNLKYGSPEYEEWKRGVLSGRTQGK